MRSRLALAGAAILLAACTGRTVADVDQTVLLDRGAPADRGAPDVEPQPKALPWVSTYAGSGCGSLALKDGPRLQAVLGTLGPIALGPGGRLYFADFGGDGVSGGIRVVEGEQVRTLVPQPASGAPTGMAVTADGRIFVGGGILIRQVQDGKLVIVAGSDKGGEAGHVDGPALDARFKTITDITLDSQGRLLIAEQRYIRVLDGMQVTTLAGSGELGSGGPKDGPAMEATFGWLRAVLEVEHTIYAGDSTYLRAVQGSQVLTLAGAKGSVFAVDGPLADARFTGIRSFARKQDRLFLVDYDFAQRIRYVEQGVVHSLTDGKRGFRDGHISQALFDSALEIVVDARGDLLVSDMGNCRIRHIQLEP